MSFSDFNHPFPAPPDVPERRRTHRATSRLWTVEAKVGVERMIVCEQTP